MQENKKHVKLVIVESPAKAATINSYLGSDYKVIASKGHVRDLPKSTLGVDIEHDFKAKYINIQGKSALISEMKKEAKGADKVYLATDPDREGEAISWHLATVLGIAPEEANRVAYSLSICTGILCDPTTVRSPVTDTVVTSISALRIRSTQVNPSISSNPVAKKTYTSLITLLPFLTFSYFLIY